MATFWLLNNLPFGESTLLAGTKIDDGVDPKSAIETAGGVLVATGTAEIDTAAAVAQGFHLRGQADFAQGAMLAAVAKKGL